MFKYALPCWSHPLTFLQRTLQLRRVYLLWAFRCGARGEVSGLASCLQVVLHPAHLDAGTQAGPAGPVFGPRAWYLATIKLKTKTINWRTLLNKSYKQTESKQLKNVSDRYTLHVSSLQQQHACCHVNEPFKLKQILVTTELSCSFPLFFELTWPRLERNTTKRRIESKQRTVSLFLH